MGPKNPNNVEPECALKEPDHKEYLDPENNWNSAPFTISSTNFSNQYNN